MNYIKTKKIHNTALFFVLIAPFAIIFYASYLFNPINAGNPFLYVLQLFADSIAIINLAALWLTILLDLIQPEYHKRNYKYDKKWLDTKPLSVDILVPVANEPLSIIKKTIAAAAILDYPHKTYVLDDGNSQEVRKLAASLQIEYIARPYNNHSYAKAGNINYGLKYCQGDIFAIFDADHIPEKDFIIRLLPFFQNEKIALVQTPQHYTNTDKFIAEGTAEAQEIFYKYVQPAKNSYNASFCVGTNMFFRRDAIDKIGGIKLIDHSEDIWTTIHLHELGYESIFYNKVLAKGRAPETIQSFFRQQNRWARGGFSLFFTRNPLFLDQLSLDQRLQYCFSSIYYFSGFSILLYLLFPVLFLLTGNHSMNMLHSQSWLIHFIPYFVTIYFLPFFLLGRFQLSTISTAIASFYPYLQAFFSIVLKNRYKWVATESNQRIQTVLMVFIWPHVLFIFLSLTAICVGWYNAYDTTTTAIITFWALLNAYFLFVFVKQGIINE